MAKNVANLLDSYYTLSVSADGQAFKKVEHLQNAVFPPKKRSWTR
ncbi:MULTISPECIES: hypothetical protein [unclassified Moraxella]|nr:MULTISPECIES: hypothetical protein [unclassified Moraxella]